MTRVAYPFGPAPTQYGPCVWNQAGSKGRGVHYPGDTVTVELEQAGATGYIVRDYFGTLVSSGSMLSSATICTPTPPGGGWSFGRYRIYFTGPLDDALFRTSYSITSFCVIPTDSRFLTMPAGNVYSPDSGFGEFADLIAKPILGMGTSRAIIGNASAATLSTASFTHPALNANVTVQVADTAWMLATSLSVLPYIYISGAGAYTISSITDGTHVVLTNAGFNTCSPGTVIGSGAHVSDRDLYVCEAMAATGQTYWLSPGAPYLDTTRPRAMWATFPNVRAPGSVTKGPEAYDLLALPDTGSGVYLNCYTKTGAIDGSQVFVKVDPGTSSGNKVTVYYPNTSTLVETYDNLANGGAASVAINAASAYVAAFPYRTNPAATGATQAATAIGHKTFTSVALIVSILYADGITRFEGPSNEPDMNAETAQQMRLFQAAVHAGNASAKAIGPCPVNIDPSWWKPFLDAGGGAYCDELATHMYSPANGDFNLQRAAITAWQAQLASYGLGDLVIWQTESTQATTSVVGVYHPRRARLSLLDTLLLEQFGIPRERNNPWYDISHGFWDFMVAWEMADGSLEAQAPMYRTLDAQTREMSHNQILDFGDPGNRIFLGSVYSGSAGKTVVIVTGSFLPGATVTLATSATGTLTVTDAFGNTSTVAVTNGRVTVPVQEIPTYLALPAGATVTVFTVNDWPQIKTAGQGTSSASRALVQVGGTPVPALADGTGFTNYYAHYRDQPNVNADTTPTSVVLSWPTAARGDRVILWAPPPNQRDSVPITFTIETSTDGSTWVTQKTVDVSASCVSIAAASDASNVGCQYETYWHEQWIFDVKLPAPVTCKALRINVTAVSHGGEPVDIDPAVVGQGDYQHLNLMQVAFLCDDNTLTKWASH